MKKLIAYVKARMKEFIVGAVVAIATLGTVYLYRHFKK